MAVPNVKSTHIGRKIERLRELRGIKQDALAGSLGISQQAVSKMEQSEEVDDARLAKVAEILGVSVDAIKQFNEDALVNLINDIHNNTFESSSSAFIYNQFNPIDKLMQVVEHNRKLSEENKNLYERLLESERKRNDLLESLLKGK